MSAVTHALKRDNSNEDKENLVVQKTTKGGKTELRELPDWQSNHGKLEEDQMEEDMISAKRKMKQLSVEAFSITLTQCQP